MNRSTALLGAALCVGVCMIGCDAIDDFSPFHGVGGFGIGGEWPDGAVRDLDSEAKGDGGVSGPDLSVSVNGSPCNNGAGTLCGGFCVDTTKDPANCRTCGHLCTAPMNGVASCDASTCVGTCPMGQVVCGGDVNGNGTCADLSSDSNHCGVCGATCGGGSACAGGQCKTAKGFGCATNSDCASGSCNCCCFCFCGPASCCCDGNRHCN